VIFALLIFFPKNINFLDLMEIKKRIK